MKKYIKSAVVPIRDEPMQVKIDLAKSPDTRLDTLKRLAEVSGPMIRYIMYSNPASAPLVEQYPELWEAKPEVVDDNLAYYMHVWAANNVTFSSVRLAITNALSDTPASLNDIAIEDDNWDDDEVDAEGGQYNICVWFSALPSHKHEVADCIAEAVAAEGIEILSDEF